jgi:hypothetical protein
MSKKEIDLSNCHLSNSYGLGMVISTDSRDRLFGKLCEVIEAVGLESKQEEAIKNLIRKSISSVFDDAKYISAEEHTKIREEHKGQGECINPIGA